MSGELLAWLRTAGVKVDDRLALRSDETGLTVFASHAIALHDILVTIPKSCVLSRRTSSLSSTPVKLEQSSESHQAAVTLALHLLHEQCMAEQSRFHGYLQSMPKDAVPLATFEPNEWSQGTDVEHHLHERSLSLEQLDTLFRDQILPILRDASLTIRPTCKLFRRAYSLVASRAFHIDQYHGLAMVPMADVFNHSAESQVVMQSDHIVCLQCGALFECEHDELPTDPDVISQDHATDTVDMIATSPIAAGQEIFNSYAPRLSNAQLYVGYGFTLDINPHDRVTWPTPRNLLPDEASSSRALALWRSVQTAEIQSAVAGLDLVHDEDTSALFLDSDARMSASLWLLLACHAQTADQTSSQDLSLLSREPGRLASICDKVYQARLASMHNGGLSVEQLLALPEAQITHHAFQIALNERLLLQAWHAEWGTQRHTDGCTE
ncbi:uncharacterized protein L969DRAFT_15435 [Mixia osmundae IAM 14324]|uniref:SET domain-containing protein n=1 Tax=Mixia osmundae (strain CBS 9802 / IAM 14324 / JCM 22182 / KY 12970) TaxID=764103 RepID=G7DY54_MIXOS|nr:uncharacterized protein L969DRAFT_15435 [Mixia osmundae IAM 14324]KEI41416.1 hypothetical protein L969DRAFT_15435 [Mixia osmundae IAM 14324]GAA95514.1 hypothetical protein E5Q_02169 [Mixia osmundae IAM 14324]